MRRILPFAVVLVAALWGLAWGQIHEEEQIEPFPTNETPFSFWMDAKLDESQNIFAALSQGDYDEIVESVNVLRTVNRLERFVRKNTPGYRTQLRAFEFAINEMETQAKAKNLEGVVLGFQQVTLSCVNCHKQLREPKEAPPARAKP